MYKRYVDHVIVIAREDAIEKIKNFVNSSHPSIQFTLENEKNNKISFLDIEIIRSENAPAKTNWFRKNTFSGPYLNFFSHHPVAQKKAFVYNSVEKSILLSYPEFRNDNIEQLYFFVF